MLPETETARDFESGSRRPQGLTGTDRFPMDFPAAGVLTQLSSVQLRSDPGIEPAYSAGRSSGLHSAASFFGSNGFFSDRA